MYTLEYADGYYIEKNGKAFIDFPEHLAQDYQKVCWVLSALQEKEENDKLANRHYPGDYTECSTCDNKITWEEYGRNAGQCFECSPEDEDSFELDWCNFCEMSVTMNENGDCPHCGTAQSEEDFLADWNMEE
mgnify:FL=1